MAQSVEHHLGKVEVPGSNPGNSSKAKTTAIGGFFFISPHISMFFELLILDFVCHYDRIRPH